MSKIERLIDVISENTRVAREQNALLRQMLGHRDAIEDLLGAYRNYPPVDEKIGVKDGLPSRELSVLSFPDDLEAYGDWDSAS